MLWCRTHVQQRTLQPKDNIKKTWQAFFIMLEVFVTSFCINIPSLKNISRLLLLAVTANGPLILRITKKSTYPAESSSSTRSVTYVSHPSSFTRWCILADLSKNTAAPQAVGNAGAPLLTTFWWGIPEVGHFISLQFLLFFVHIRNKLESIRQQDMFDCVTLAQACDTRRKNKRQHVVRKWFHLPVPLPSHVPFCWQGRQKLHAGRACLKRQTPRLFWALSTRSTKLMNRSPCSYEPCHLVHELQVAPSKELFRV